MARKNETALMYSSIPCDILNRRSTLKAVYMARRDQLGEAFISCLLFVILYLQIVLHRTKNGYYATCDDDFVEDIARETCIDDKDVLKALELAAKANVIDTDFYVKKRIVTSEPIQDAYFSAMARGRRRCPQDTPYLLVDLNDYHFVKDTSEETRITTEGKGISSEDKGITSEETRITSEEKGISSEDKGITSEGKTRNVKSNRNNNVMYMSSSERKEIELFFHSEKGFAAWAEITDDIVGRMDPVGWIDSYGRTIHDKVKYAMAWTVREEFTKRGSIFPDDGARQAYQELYQVLANRPERHLLTQITFVRLVDKRLVLRVTSEEVSDFIDRNIASYKDKIKLFNGITYEKQKYND